jgi:hypothetical protein
MLSYGVITRMDGNTNPYYSEKTSLYRLVFFVPGTLPDSQFLLPAPPKGGYGHHIATIWWGYDGGMEGIITQDLPIVAAACNHKTT